MKKLKYALAFSLSLVLLLDVLPASAQTDIRPQAALAVSPQVCIALSNNVRFGMFNSAVAGDVITLQEFLRAKGYLVITRSTGYFGSLTLSAVKNFQRDQDLPQTGFVGPLTRERIRLASCSSSTSSITVVSPNGGEKLVRGVQTNIVWRTPDVTYIQAPKFDIYLVPEPPACLTTGPVRCMIAIQAPFNVATNVIGSAGVSAFSWKVGATADQDRTIYDGIYRIQVCNAGSQTCDMSDQTFSIVSSTTSTATTSAATIKVTSPNEVIVSNRGTVLPIRWTYATMSSASTQKVTITLEQADPYSPTCTYYPCPTYRLMVAPYPLVKDYPLSTGVYNWVTGNTTDTTRPIPDGRYYVRVCTDTAEQVDICDMSDLGFTIITQ